MRATPGGGPGTLSITDSRTGRQYSVDIGPHGTIKATDLKQIAAGGDGVGLRTYDNGCGSGVLFRMIGSTGVRICNSRRRLC